MAEPKFSIFQELFWISTQEIAEQGTQKTLWRGIVAALIKPPNGAIKYNMRDFFNNSVVLEESALYDSKEAAQVDFLTEENPE